jgi:hypothetical protein
MGSLGKHLLIGAVALLAFAGLGKAQSRQDSGAFAARVGPAPEAFRVARIPATTRVQRTGTLRVRVEMDATPQIPDGTQVSVSIGASLVDASYSNQSSAFGTATVANRKAVVNVDINYAWLTASTASRVAVSATLSGGSGSGALRYRNSSLASRVIRLPADGATTLVRLPVGL